MPGGITGLPCSSGNKNRNLALQVREVSKIDTIKYGHEFHRAHTQESLHWRLPETIKKYRPDLLSGRVLHINKPLTV
jgi:hypothetical protein